MLGTADRQIQINRKSEQKRRDEQGNQPEPLLREPERGEKKEQEGGGKENSREMIGKGKSEDEGEKPPSALHNRTRLDDRQ